MCQRKGPASVCVCIRAKRGLPITRFVTHARTHAGEGTTGYGSRWNGWLRLQVPIGCSRDMREALEARGGRSSSRGIAYKNWRGRESSIWRQMSRKYTQTHTHARRLNIDRWRCWRDTRQTINARAFRLNVGPNAAASRFLLFVC